MADYLLQEDDASKLILEDGSGDILLESGGPPPVVVEPGGSHIIAVAPRRRLLDKRNRRGRLKWSPAVVDVYAPSPKLEVALGARSAILETQAGHVRTRLSFVLKPAHAIANYAKERSVDRELQIRKLLISDLFNRDDHR